MHFLKPLDVSYLLYSFEVVYPLVLIMFVPIQHLLLPCFLIILQDRMGVLLPSLVLRFAFSLLVVVLYAGVYLALQGFGFVVYPLLYLLNLAMKLKA